MKMKIERVDDIPLLIGEMNKSNLSELLNEYFPRHGNWEGLDGGKVTVAFLSYILSCSDHRLSHVEPWASERIETLRYCLEDSNITCKDFTDDRLGLLLDKYAEDEKWQEFESIHNQSLINVYNLDMANEAIRLDAMLTKSHREASGDFQYGFSKQHRADLPQLKTMVAALDPLALPLFSCTTSGNKSDDELYLPVIQQCESMGLSHQLFVGDSKMGSQRVRFYLQNKGHYYLTPLNKKQCKNEILARYLDSQPEELVTLYKNNQENKKDIEFTGLKQPKEVRRESRTIKAKAFEVMETMNFIDNEIEHKWNERRIIVYSPLYGERQKQTLENQIQRAKDKLSVIVEPKKGRKRLRTLAEVEIAINKILEQYKVKSFFKIIIDEHVTVRIIKKHKNRPQREERTSTFTLDIQIDEDKLQQHIERLGWSVYACNATVEKLSTEQAVICYRNEYRIEHKFDELMNRITTLLPVFLQKENRIKALIRLLLLALKFVSAIQYQVRQYLKDNEEDMKGIYAGNPARATKKPTTNLMLRAFRNIHLNIVSIQKTVSISVNNLNPTQIQIIKALNFKEDIYYGMNQLSLSNFDFSET